MVFRAHQASLDRQVAVKVISAEDPHRTDSGTDSVERALQEARLVAEVVHPNIVTVYDCGFADGYPYIVMEYVKGRSLASVLRERGRPPSNLALALFLQLTRALQAAHDRGIIHRDVKPANVLLTPRSGGGFRAKLTDFGVARPVGTSRSADRTVQGTPAYMPPEQARGLPVDGRSDLYGLGVLMVRTLTGRTPFEGADPAAMATQHVTKPVPSFAELAPGVRCPELEAIARRCLAKNPRDRYPSADALLADLEMVQLTSTVWHRAVHAVGAAWDWLRPPRVESRRSLGAGLIVGIVVSMLGAATFAALPDDAPASTDASSATDTEERVGADEAEESPSEPTAEADERVD